MSVKTILILVAFAAFCAWVVYLVAKEPSAPATKEDPDPERVYGAPW